VPFMMGVSRKADMNRDMVLAYEQRIKLISVKVWTEIGATLQGCRQKGCSVGRQLEVAPKNLVAAE